VADESGRRGSGAADVAVVTGGGRGIGRAVALALAEAGVDVAVVARTREQIDAVAAEVRALGRRSCPVAADLTEPIRVAEAFREVRAALGDPTILVNDAGIAHSARFESTDDATWERLLRVNLLAAVSCTREALPAMLRAGRGRIVNVASTAAKTGFAYTTAYTASKHALLGFTRALALETADRGVTVNAVCPGFVDTDIVRTAVRLVAEKGGISEDEARRRLETLNPQKRLLRPEEVARVVVHLTSPDAAGINGQAWNLDGGAVTA